MLLHARRSGQALPSIAECVRAFHVYMAADDSRPERAAFALLHVYTGFQQLRQAQTSINGADHKAEQGCQALQVCQDRPAYDPYCREHNADILLHAQKPADRALYHVKFPEMSAQTHC